MTERNLTSSSIGSFATTTQNRLHRGELFAFSSLAVCRNHCRARTLHIPRALSRPPRPRTSHRTILNTTTKKQPDDNINSSLSRPSLCSVDECEDDNRVSANDGIPHWQASMGVPAPVACAHSVPLVVIADAASVILSERVFFCGSTSSESLQVTHCCLPQTTATTTTPHHISRHAA